MASHTSLNYLNTDIVYLRNKKIEEYDIREGGYSVALNEGLFDDDFKEYLATLNKHERHVAIGKHSIDNKEFTKELHAAFKKYIALFIATNEINPDNILSIKKDSITVYSSDVYKRKSKHVEFIKKGAATSYLLLNKKEFFFNNHDSLAVIKGLSDTVLSEGTIVGFIFDLLKKAEYINKDKLYEMLYELRQAYVTLELTASYYRELNSVNAYKVKERLGEFEVYLEQVSDDRVSMLDIRYNYVAYILPLLKIFI